MKSITLSMIALVAMANIVSGQVRVQIVPAPAYQVPIPGKPGEKTEFQPAAGSSPDPKSLDVDEVESAKAKEFVRQLSSPAYKERDSATKDIAKMGRFAVPALKDALASESSPEVRMRIDLVLPKAEAEDMKARVSCFLLDKEGKYEHQLPGWTKFKEQLGNDKVTRELFAEVLVNKKYHPLLLACDLPPNELGAILSSHYLEAQNRANMNQNGRSVNVQPTTAEIAVLAFLESMHTDKVMPIITGQVYTSVGSYLYSGDVMAAMSPSRQSGKYSSVLKKILIRWLDSRESITGLQQAMTFVQSWQMLSEVPKYAAKVLASDAQNGNWYPKLQALMVIGQNKEGKKYVPQIAKVFDDTNLLQQAVPGQAMHNIQLGDFALGVAMKLAGQNPKDYGLEVKNTQAYANWQQDNYYFKDDKDNKAEDRRKACIKKFNEWIANQPKEEPKKDEPKKEAPKASQPVQPKKD
jgi:hypothetical protein